MLAVTITLLLAGLLLALFQSASDIWRKSTGRARTFQSARAAFETISRNVATATLITYQD